MGFYQHKGGFTVVLKVITEISKNFWTHHQYPHTHRYRSILARESRNEWPGAIAWLRIRLRSRKFSVHFSGWRNIAPDFLRRKGVRKASARTSAHLRGIRLHTGIGKSLLCQNTKKGSEKASGDISG